MEQKYKDPTNSIEIRVEDLLSRMTKEEKIGQMVQISYNQVNEVEAKEWASKRNAGSFLHIMGKPAMELQELALKTRLGIPLLFGIDAVRGHALHNGATIFPTQLSMACSWNRELIEKAGRVTASEVAADGLHWTFSPLLCIGRDLRWGRINETFGEDPYLIGELATAIIKGYQGRALSDPDSILACAKHYVAYGESFGGRDAYDTPISIRKLREVFLPPFKEAADTKCATFMASYQSIDGMPVSANRKVLYDILKKEIGFEGFVVTDWNNTGSLVDKQRVAFDIKDAAKKAIEAGNDMIMTTPDFYDAAIELLEKGEVCESHVDEAVKRILRIKFAMGLFDNRSRIDLDSMQKIFACEKHVEANMKLTREAIVLLENKNKTLPLKKSIRKIAVIGPNADDGISQLGDWTFFSHPNPGREKVSKLPIYTMFEGIKEIAEKDGIDVIYHKGCHIMNEEEEEIAAAVKLAGASDVIIAVVGDCLIQNGEFRDRADLNLSGAQERLLKELKQCGKPLVVILVNGKPLSIPWIRKNADAVIEAFNSGILGGKATAEIIFGITNPSGKLPISFPYHVGQLPVYYNQLPGWHGGKYIDMPQEPLYSFGYGLSYTTFNYSNLKVSKAECSNGDSITVSVDVANTGDYDGNEIVQLYVRDLVSSVVTPVKMLKGFKKVNIKKGETVKVEIPLKMSQLTIVDMEENYVLEPGEFEIMVGPDSRDEVLLKTIISVK